MTQQRIPLWRFALFASPLTPLTVAFLPLVILLPGFYAQDLGIDVAAVGLVLILARAVDAFSDPLVGYFSDKTDSKWGRRRPWMIIGTPALMLAVWMLFVPPEDATIWYLYPAIIAVYVSWTFIFIPLQAWGAELTNDYSERTRLNVFQGLFNTLGVFGCLLVPFFFLSPQSAEVKQWAFGWLMNGDYDVPDRLDRILSFNGQGAVPFQDIMFILALVVVVILPTTVLLCLSFNKERPSEPKATNWRDALVLLKRNPVFARVLIGNFFLQISVQLWIAAQPFYLAYILKMPENLLLLLVIQQGFALVTVPAWGYISKLMGRGRGLGLAGLCMILGFGALFTIPEASLVWALVPYLLLGAASDGKWMLPISLAYDSADYDRWRNGKKEEGLHLAVLFLTNKIGIAMGGLTLIAFGFFGFQPGSEENSEVAITAVKYISTLIPLICSTIGLMIMWNFPLTQRAHAAVLRRLEARAANTSS